MPHYQTQLSSPIEALKASNSLFNCLILLFQTDYFKNIFYFYFCQTLRPLHNTSFYIKNATFHLADQGETFIQKVSQLYIIKSIQTSSISSSLPSKSQEDYQCLLCKICFFTFALKHFDYLPSPKEVALLSIFFVKSTSLYSSFASIFSHVSVTATQ